MAPTPVAAHGSLAIPPGALWTAWEPNFLVFGLLIVIHLLYGHGVFCRWREAGSRLTITRRHMLLFAAGEAVLAIALLSPLEALSGTLFSAHMVQHILLIAVAPPLLLAGRVDVAFFLALRGKNWRIGRIGAVQALASVWRFGERPLVATAIHGSIIWIWHAPRAFEAALTTPTLHDAEHLTFFISALLFWRGLFRAGRAVKTAAAGALAALLTLLHGGFLGALISFAPRPLYPGYVWTGLWGLTPLEDQQIAGLIMWVPASFIYLAAGLALTGRVLYPTEPVSAESRI